MVKELLESKCLSSVVLNNDFNEFRTELINDCFLHHHLFCEIWNISCLFLFPQEVFDVCKTTKKKSSPNIVYFPVTIQIYVFHVSNKIGKEGKYKRGLFIGWVRIYYIRSLCILLYCFQITDKNKQKTFY